jgi:parallel beta-helix repeat protein
VVLDGSAITDEQVNGLRITSNGNIIRGLQIINFSNAAVALLGGAQNNIVGGDRSVGAGPLGQGNLLSGNGSFGVGIWDTDTSFNTIIGNYIGTDLSGTAAWSILRDGVHINGASYNQIIDNLISGNEQNGLYICCSGEGNTVRNNCIGSDISGLNPLGNVQSGVCIDQGARDSVIGPDNIIAYNNEDGVAIHGSNSLGNTITQNSIHDNGRQGIALWEGGNAKLPTPSIFDFDLAAGAVTGGTCANYTVEIFSDEICGGEIYEGKTMADSLGVFTFNKGVSFTGPHLTATTTDADGDTSPFSAPTWGTSRSTILQEGNNLPKTQLQTNESRELDDNRIGAGFCCLWPPQDYEQVLNTIGELGLKRVELTIQENEAPIDWSKPELDIPPEFDNFITALFQNGITITYVLSFWDKANHPQGWEGISSRFKTEEEIQRYLDFVRFIVSHFKDRVQYFKIWNEPDNCGDPAQCVQVADMVNLIRRAVPVIHQEYPEAKVVIPSNVIFYAQDYLFGILNSDVMPIVDVVAWQTMPDFGPSDESWRAFYFNYPSLVQQIKDTASAHGFTGEYWASELTWWFPAHPSPPLPYPDSVIVDVKGHTRGITVQLCLGVTITALGTYYEPIIAWPMIRNLCTVMAGAEVVSLPVTIDGAAADIKMCVFSLPDGSHMVILWRDVEPMADDPGVKVNLTLQGFAGQDVVGIDVLNGFQQPIMASDENGNLVISNLFVRDYPLILRLSPPSIAYGNLVHPETVSFSVEPFPVISVTVSVVVVVDVIGLCLLVYFKKRKR